MDPFSSGIYAYFGSTFTDQSEMHSAQALENAKNEELSLPSGSYQNRSFCQDRLGIDAKER
jgi:hypothetical protein